MAKKQKVATLNAQVQDLQNQVAELKYQLNEVTKINDIYYNITRYGRYEVKNNEDLNACMIVLNDCDYREEIEDLKIFEERGQKVYIVYEKDYGWKIEYKNANGIVVRLTPTQLFHSPIYNLLDDIDDLK